MTARGLWLNVAVKALLVGLLLFSVLAVGFGAATEILWKLGSFGLQLTYDDTIGDLALGFCGTLLGASLVSARWKLSRT